MRLCRPRLLVPVAIIAAGALAFGLIWFQPWKLWVDHRVDETLPALATAPVTSVPASPATPSSTPGPRLLARGHLVSHAQQGMGLPDMA